MTDWDHCIQQKLKFGNCQSSPSHIIELKKKQQIIVYISNLLATWQPTFIMGIAVKKSKSTIWKKLKIVENNQKWQSE